MFGTGPQQVRVRQAHRSWELGLKFSASENGRVVALRYYRAGKDLTSHRGTLWTSNGQVLSLFSPAYLPHDDQARVNADPDPQRMGKPLTQRLHSLHKS